jgi:hypothetical protein
MQQRPTPRYVADRTEESSLTCWISSQYNGAEFAQHLSSVIEARPEDNDSSENWADWAVAITRQCFHWRNLLFIAALQWKVVAFGSLHLV